MKSLRCLYFLVFAILATVSLTSVADDTDIFNQPPGVTPPAPNIIFIVDNTANWSKASQHWVGSSSQGAAVLLAIQNLVAGLTKTANVGLMMVDETPNEG